MYDCRGPIRMQQIVSPETRYDAISQNTATKSGANHNPKEVELFNPKKSQDSRLKTILGRGSFHPSKVLYK